MKKLGRITIFEASSHSVKRDRKAWEMRPCKITKQYYRYVALFILLADNDLMDFETGIRALTAFQRFPVQMNLSGAYRTLPFYLPTLLKVEFSKRSE